MPSWETLAPSLGQLPLWDPEPLRTAYNQLQAIYGYYHFAHVNYDRYVNGGRESQVAIAVREFSAQGLPDASKNWVTLRLNPKYTRGMGAVVSPVEQATPDGEPVMWLGNVNPVVKDANAPPELELRDPRAFFGEMTTDYVIVQPGKDSLVTLRASGLVPTGVTLSSFVRLLAFAWRFDDKNLLFSGDLTSDSKLLFRRTIAERLAARRAVPAVGFRSVSGDQRWTHRVDRGRLCGVGQLPARTSHPDRRRGQCALPAQQHQGDRGRRDRGGASLRSGQERPGARDVPAYFPVTLRAARRNAARPAAHLRYSPLYFNAQADVLEEYHLLSPEAFYAGQDVWQIPQEIAAPGVPRPYHANFATMRFPGSAHTEFLLGMPFIARQRQNMTALLIGRSDAPRYGELELLELPRDKQIPGPTQVQAIIEQDPMISPQLTLWRQSGSDVNLGHMRIVPLDSGFIYVQPLFLSTQTQGSSIPELQRVVVSDGRAVVMGHSLPEAVRSVASPETQQIGGTPTGAQQPRTGAPVPPGQPGAVGAQEWRQAYDLLQEADRRLKSGDFAGFGAKWTELRQMLERLSRTRP